MGRIVDGLLEEPKRAASGAVYPGRFTCRGVQWTESGSDLLVTFTITGRELADAADTKLLWTDQDVQRGIKPGLPKPVPREIPLADGYPDPGSYIFDSGKADDIVDKLLEGSRLFLNPLVWNLRPGHFSAFWNEPTEELYIYSGRVYLPDSHHRQQAIVKAVQAYDEDPASYPAFSPDIQFKVELYFLSKEDEGNYFYDKNQLPKPTSKSKSYDLTTQDDLSILAKHVIRKSEALQQNVNRVTDRLTASNPQVMTLSTLRQMMKLLAPSETIDETEIEGLAEVAATFYDLLAQARPELGLLDRDERNQVRRTSLVDAAVIMYGYAYLMTDFNRDIPRLGLGRAVDLWSMRLGLLSQSYTYGEWSGDLFSRDNPLWIDLGVLKPKASGGLTVTNTGATRAQAGRVLRAAVAEEGGIDLTGLRP